MADRIKLYMDENVTKAVTEGLRRRGIDVVTAQDANMLAKSDEMHLEFATKEGRVIFTQDADFLRLNAKGYPHKGIVYAPQQTPIGKIVSALMLIIDVMEPEDLEQHVEFI
ncbi:MAG: DUF5615 family PIN-like protein [bacterium]